MRIELPYPPAALNPNKRMHWAKKSRAAKRYRADCHYLTPANIPMGLEFRLLFHPPDRRVRDLDNAIAAFKPGQDGMADAWGVDDADFRVHYPRQFSEPVKHGMVVVETL